METKMIVPRISSNIMIVAGGLASAALFIGYGSYKLLHNMPVASEVPSVLAPMPAPATTGYIVSRTGIARGSVIEADALDTLIISGPAPAEATASASAVIGKIAIADIPAHQLVLTSLVSADPGRAGLSFTVPQGFRAITIRTNDEIAVANFIRPKDRIDISLALHANVLPKQTDAQQVADGDPSEAHTVLQGVEVLAVGETLEDPALALQNANAQSPRRVDPPKSITVAMTPDQISQFVLARSLGGFYLTLRNPADAGVTAMGPSVLKDIRGRTPPPATAMVQADRPIELITGTRSKTIYSTQRGAP